MTGTVYFLSDYGTQDEFVGVVHAVLAAACPSVGVIDLTHHIAPFDVRAGSHCLVRAAPYLGAGVVLAVVDPGVGSQRRGLCLQVTPQRAGPAFFVGPDNGLLVAAAEQVADAPVARAFALHRPGSQNGHGSTFDGRDVFAPVAAALCRGIEPEQLGDPIEPHSLVRLGGAVVEHGRDAAHRRYLRTEVLWVDHFGNIALAATAADAQAAALPRTGSVAIAAGTTPAIAAGTTPAIAAAARTTLRRVQTFDELDHRELGLLVDSNGHLAVVAGRAPAAEALTVAAGAIIVLSW